MANSTGTILALGIVGAVAYLYRDKIKAVFNPGPKPIASFASGVPTPGNIAGGEQPWGTRYNPDYQPSTSYAPSSQGSAAGAVDALGNISSAGDWAWLGGGS